MKSNNTKPHYVYVLRCADNTLYTGYATDLVKRVAEHNGVGSTVAARTAGAKYTAGRRPVTLVYQESFVDRSAATKREYAIKQLTKQQKEQLIDSWQEKQI